jgi:hypothetical protein
MISNGMWGMPFYIKRKKGALTRGFCGDSRVASMRQS